ncbi:WecB/TagA/CpsF family glycosyltransferase, partial [Klebsiella variicola]
VGAAFDFLAGTVSEAPSFVRNSGFEWMYRLASEPKRLWRRYLFGNSTFVRLASRDIRKFLGRSRGHA